MLRVPIPNYSEVYHLPVGTSFLVSYEHRYICYFSNNFFSILYIPTVPEKLPLAPQTSSTNNRSYRITTSCRILARLVDPHRRDWGANCFRVQRTNPWCTSMPGKRGS